MLVQIAIAHTERMRADEVFFFRSAAAIPLNEGIVAVNCNCYVLFYSSLQGSAAPAPAQPQPAAAAAASPAAEGAPATVAVTVAASPSPVAQPGPSAAAIERVAGVRDRSSTIRQKIEKDSSLYTCDICKDSFSIRMQLESHMSKAHPGQAPIV